MNASYPKPKSLYRELTIAMVVLVSLVSVAVNLFNYLYSSREAEAIYQSKSSEYAVALHKELEWPLWNIDDELIVKIGSAFTSNAEIASLTIRDDQQRVIYHREKSDKNQARRKVAVEHNGHNIGSVEIGLSLSVYEERNRQLLLVSILTMVLLIVVLLGATRWILSRLLKKPVDTFVGATGAMVEGKYRQIELPETYVEFAPILSGFKTMSDAVASRESSLRQTNEHLAAEIAERKQAEQQLRRSEHGLAEAQRIAHLGNWELNLENNVLTWSDEIYRIFEIDPEQFGASYDAFLNAIHPDDREMVNNAYTESVKSKAPYDIVHRLRMNDGRVKYVNEKCETHYDENGKPLVSVGTVHDITVRKLDEEALRRLNRELHAISNCNQTLMRAEDEQALLDDICHIICEDAGYRMAWVGYTENDEAKTIRPVSWAGVESGYLEQAKLSWADTERGHGPSGTAIRSGESVSIQDFITDPKATPWRDAALQRGYRSSISLPLKDENEKTFGILNIYASMPNAFTPSEIRLLEELAGDMAFGIMVLRARIERQRAEESLRQMNERFSLATRAGRLGVWDWDLQKNELLWDDRMYELYGVNRKDFVGAYEAWLKGLHPDDRARSDEISMQAQRGEREYDTEFRVVWPDSSVHYLKAYGQFVRDADGRPVRMTGVNYDITELKEAENKIDELNRDLERRVIDRTAQLAEANKELEAFSYSVSHDLRTPLRAIDGFSHILLDDYADKLDDEGRRLLGVVRDNTSRMGQLIDDILKFSRTGRLELSFSEIDMEGLAREVFDELRPAAGHELQVEIEGIPQALGDRAMMRQVFVNLLSNAIKFSRSSETAKIKVGGSIAGDEAVYFVQDNGVGFDMQYADKLFGVFQRLHTVNEFEGTGIGLAIVKRVVTRHGGRVWAEGKVGEGATIYFALPIKSASQLP